MATKICSRCGIEQDVSMFYKQKTHSDGLKSRCKKCISEYHKKYYLNNKEKRSKYSKKYTKKRCKTDSLFKFKYNIRTNIRKSFTRFGYSKSTHTEEIWLQHRLFSRVFEADLLRQVRRRIHRPRGTYRPYYSS